MTGRTGVGRARVAPAARRALVVALVAVMGGVGMTVPAARAAATYYSGYVPMVDGAELKYTVAVPAGGGRHPVAMLYNAYDAANDPLGELPTTLNGDPVAPLLLADGFAVLGVAVRGTNCSDGQVRLFDDTVGSDGAAIVEWAAGQPWSNGHVGMFGTSYPSLTAVLTAEHRPAHLDAIVPAQIPIGDSYRDGLYAGGIWNPGYTEFGEVDAQLVFGEPGSAGGAAGAAGATTGTPDPACVTNQWDRPAGPVGNLADTVDHPYVDGFWAEHSASTAAADVDVPVLGAVAWQDEATESRTSSSLFDQFDPKKLWVVGSNGYHEMFQASPAFQDLERRFLAHFVAGASNGFETTPHVQLWHDTHQGVDRHGEPPAPAWISTAASWPLRPRPTELHLAAGGRLTPITGNGGPDNYTSPLPSSPVNTYSVIAGPTPWLADAPGGTVAYTSAPLVQDQEFAGPGSLNLWLSSTSRDTDLQVTLSEVRPDGLEVYVQRGWLRASHRALDVKRSTKLQPVQTHLASDAQPMPPGEPVLARVEVFPFDYVFRSGSSIRVTVGAPTGVTGFWAFDTLPVPSVNSIWHDSTHDSELVLGLLPGASAATPLRPCLDLTLLNQPCRPA
jgi:putative CocE/NonD family hydrolase